MTWLSVHEKVEQLLKQFPSSPNYLLYFLDYFEPLAEHHDIPTLSKQTWTHIVAFVRTLYELEPFSQPMPRYDQCVIDTLEGARYRDQLLRLYGLASHHDKALQVFTITVASSCLAFIKHLPPQASEGNDSVTTVPLVDLIDVPAAITDVLQPFTRADFKLTDLFSDLLRQLAQNQFEASKGNADKVISPQDYKGTPHDTAAAYLKNTPFYDLFACRVPFSIPSSARLEHTSILGGSGAGKTTLIQQLILDDFAQEDPPPLVVIDPKGQLVERVQKLALFHPEDGRLKDRLVVIDPTDTPPPALNMFHMPEGAGVDETLRSQLEVQAVSNFAYIFSTILSPLTQRQAVCFTFCVRLLFRLKGATIHTLAELLDDTAKTAHASAFYPTMMQLDQTSRRFFENDYYTSAYLETRQQIKGRLYGILIHPQLLSVFSTPERKLDMFECLQNKKIVLVNAGLGAPGSEPSQLLARYFVALTLNAAFQRITLRDRSKWHPAYLIVDEFQLVADEVKTPEMLRLAREYNLGIVMAFQEIHGRPFNDSLRASLSTNTSVKYASSPEGVDIAYAARDLRCDPEFLRDQTKTATHARFACFVRGAFARPVSITVPFGNIQSQSALDAGQQRTIRARMLAQYAFTPPPPAEQPPEPSPPSLREASLDPAVPPDPDTGSHTEAATKWGD